MPLFGTGFETCSAGPHKLNESPDIQSPTQILNHLKGYEELLILGEEESSALKPRRYHMQSVYEG